uniref:Lipocalin n=1 Tax=Rhipicephalus appendiculatus TaxID=34631 RepID=A0A131Z729_RHIAP
MAGMCRITVLALLFTAARKFCNVAGVEAEQDCKPNVFKQFWTNYTKVWTIWTTDDYYDCQWEERENMNETGLQIATHFLYYNKSYTWHRYWMFDENNTLTSLEEPIGVYKRHLVYQNTSCAVLKVELWWFVNASGNNEEEPKDKEERTTTKPDEDGFESVCVESDREGKCLCNSRPHYKVLANDSATEDDLTDCIHAYNRTRGKLFKSVKVYKPECKNTSRKYQSVTSH